MVEWGRGGRVRARWCRVGVRWSSGGRSGRVGGAVVE